MARPLDDSHVCATLAELLDELGYGHASAANATAGLALADSLAPQAILLDINLGTIDGWHVLDQLTPALRRRVVVHSGFISASDESRAEQAGASGCLKKNFDLAALEAAPGHAASG